MIQIGQVRVVDFHIHFHAGNWRPGQQHPILTEYSRERDLRMRSEWDFDSEAEPPAGTPEAEMALADRWVAELDRYNVERAVFVTGSSNANMARVIQQHPGRFSALYYTTDPGRPETLAEITQCVEEWGFSGLKLLGPRIDYAWDDPKLIPLWRYMADKRLPALIHFGPLGKGGGVVYHRNMSPLTIYPIAREYPEINFVIPHFGCGYPQDLLQLMWSCPNIYVDTSGSNQWMRWMPYPFDLEIAFRKFYETVGPRRIVFGTDSFWFPRGFVYRYLQDQVRACRHLNLPESDLENIFARNALRLLHLLPEE